MTFPRVCVCVVGDDKCAVSLRIPKMLARCQGLLVEDAMVLCDYQSLFEYVST